MAQYRVRPGYTHGAFNQYTAGAVVELSEEEAAGLLDKLELVPAAKPGADSKAKAKPGADPKPEADPEPDPGEAKAGA